jgi:tRNA(adenine34) deaminase
VVTGWWVELASPWQACLDLAWEAFGAGSIPIGAVVVDPDRGIVARGRNRQREMVAPPPQLAGTNLAHAEVNALVQLARGAYPSYTLYSTLQPCLLCTGAICHTRIGHVRFAAADPVFVGIDRLPELNAHVARRWPRWYGPDENDVSTWSQLLTFVFAVRDDPSVMSAMALRSTDAHDRATAIIRLASSLDELTGAALVDVLADTDTQELHGLFGSLVRDWWPKSTSPTP